MDQSAEDTLFIWHEVVIECETIITYYGSLDDANKYFDSRLQSDAWTSANFADRRKALIMATRAIDRLNFSGKKSYEEQKHQFPRGKDVNVPSEIKIATYEEAIKLLDGVDPEMEQANLSAVSQGISTVRATYDRAVIPENVKAGIVSYQAWNCLLPFLRDPDELTLSRV